jgi:hypothetical protein
MHFMVPMNRPDSKLKSWQSSGIQVPVFGTSARGVGDVNGDGYDDVVVGSPQFADGQAGEGRVELFLGREGFFPAPVAAPIPSPDPARAGFEAASPDR